MSGSTGFGITPQGFVMPQLTDIQTAINDTLRARFGAGINVRPQSFFGEISGIFSERELLVWQGMQDTYKSQIPSEAFGASLDNVGDLRGIPRLGPLPSKIQNVRLFGTAGTLVPGTTTQFSVDGSPTSVFYLDQAVTLLAGQSCIQHIAFSSVPAAGTWAIAIGGTTTTALAHGANAATVQAAVRLLEFCGGCIVTGDYVSGFDITFAGAGTGGFMVQSLFVIQTTGLVNSVPTAVTVTPTITTPGIDQANVMVTATADGPTIANSGTLTNVVTPITGLTGVLNTQDAAVGRLNESDNAYRLRMTQELQTAGASTVEAIRTKILQVEGVTNALVFENITDIEDIAGRPPHCFEVVVLGGEDVDIAAAIWAAKPAGIPSFGTSSYVITDSQGQTHTIYFSRPYEVPVYIIANISIDLTYPADGDVLVKEALVNYGNSLGIGTELIVIPKLISQLASITGIQDAELLVGIAPGPTLPDNITPTSYQVLTFDTGNVQVNHV